ncbi:hypothetical protein [Deinococcus humi]|uniref:Uncharacterized protein n=1 Tax=Deinococcus humi TaxID=662880 RepID=A0A7W8NG19_9DEIO|nr:hypothetical protein [Deinococcus humi]MBB5363328.1 hypothetical protein [Deinococcus humi]GGO27082.1 hypothetical protein GCM10008949_18410 [Deinococcus humi]
MNSKLIRKAGALALTTLLALTPVAAAQQQPVLSGTTNGLAWTLYGPGDLANLSNQSNTLKVSAHPQATVVGTKYDNQSAVLAFRVNVPLMTVYMYHDDQLRAQGFTRTSQNMGDNNAQAVYTRNGSQVRLNLIRQGNNSYRATFDLSGVQMAMGNNSGQANAANTNTTPATNTATGTTPATNNSTNTGATNRVLPITVVGITKFTPEQNTAAGRNALVSAKDFAGVQYLLYGPIELNSLSNNAGTASFSIPQGSTLTETDINVNGDLTARIAGSSLNLQQVMAFYDRQFKTQGFTLVNPTDTGAGGDYALTYIYERGEGSRVSFSVEKEFDTYRLVWDFQRS